MQLCIECSKTFFNSPINLTIVILSIAIALISIILLNTKKFALKTKQYFIYSHIFFLVFPFIFYLFFNGCHSLFPGCNKLRAIILMLILSSIITFVIGIVTTPLLFLKKIKKKAALNKNKYLESFVSKISDSLKIKKPDIYIIKDDEPYAFSYIKSSIFISSRLLNLLSKKELEAVILHEVYHTKNSSSWFKFSTLFLKVSPLAAFTSIIDDINREEVNADKFTIFTQKTNRHINKAKLKIRKYNSSIIN
ncbi:M48 family metalloprotease [Candidatus Woesearchaeota archaeon]|nr:M48 family metalloprotease [Candidatus Woesearchaeota archaeon]